MESRVPFRYLQPGNYLVLRWFGMNRLYRVVGTPMIGRHGWGIDCAGREQPMYRRLYYTRLWRVSWSLCGFPQWNGFVDKETALAFVDEYPDHAFLQVLGSIIGAFSGLGEAYYPYYGEDVPEDPEDTDDSDDAW